MRAKQPGKIQLNCRERTCYNLMRAKRAGKIVKLNRRERSERIIVGKFCTFSRNSSKLRSDYLFSFQKRTNDLFPAFQGQKIYFKKVAPRGDAGGLSREYVIRIPSVSYKATKWGAVI